MSLVDMAWRPKEGGGWTFDDARMLAARVGGDEIWERGKIKMGGDGKFHMEIPTVNMVTRWLANDTGAFHRVARSGLNPDAFAVLPEFRVLLW